MSNSCLIVPHRAAQQKCSNLTKPGTEREREVPSIPAAAASEVHPDKSTEEVSVCPESEASDVREVARPNVSGAEIHVISTLDEAVQFVKKNRIASSESQNVLITGSLHLVGGALETLGIGADFPLHQQVSKNNAIPKSRGQEI